MAALTSDLLRHFRLLWNCRTDFKETWQEARSQRPLTSLCFRVDWKNKMAALAFDWQRHFSIWNHWKEFNETWQEARSQCPLSSFCLRIDQEKGKNSRHGISWAETISTFHLKPLNGIQRKLTGSKISTSSTSFVFSGRSDDFFKILLRMKINILALIYMKINFPSWPNLPAPPPPPPQNQMVAPYRNIHIFSKSS